MADDKNNPLAKSFGEMVTEWERNFDQFANQVMGTEAYSEAMNQMQKAQLTYQRNFAEAMTQQLSALNIPTREDVLNLADSLAQINLRLERIEAKLAVDDAPKRAVKKPKRTRKPPQADDQGAAQ